MFPPINKQILYHRFIVRTHDVFQRRLKKVEVELAQAQESMYILNIQDENLARDRRVALAMARHDRLGSESPLHSLPDELLDMIICRAAMV
jgi:hypothetical protein